MEFIFGLLGVILGFIVSYFASYFREKGKNLATQEDIDKLTQLITRNKFHSSKHIEVFKGLHEKLAAFRRRCHNNALSLYDEPESIEEVLEYDDGKKSTLQYISEIRQYYGDNKVFLPDKSKEAVEHLINSLDDIVIIEKHLAAKGPHDDYFDRGHGLYVDAMNNIDKCLQQCLDDLR